MEKNKTELKGIVPILAIQNINNENISVISAEELMFVITCLKYHINYQYSLLSCISGVDLLNKKYRFCVAYDLLSLSFNSNKRIKIFLNEITFVNSIEKLYINAN